MAKNITVGIDVGSHAVKVVVSEDRKGAYRGFPVVLGTGTAESKGLRHGYIINSSDVVRAVKVAVAAAEKSAGVRVRRGYVSIGGVSLEGIKSRGETVISRADRAVTDLDVNQALKDAEGKLGQKLLNRRLIHVIPI